MDKFVKELTKDDLNLICRVYNSYGCNNCPLNAGDGNCKNHTSQIERYKDDIINTKIPLHIQIGEFFYEKMRDYIPNRRGENIVYDEIENHFGSEFMKKWLKQ